MTPSDANPALRARLAAEWARAGCAEHASIASFARFTLQLLAVGAPAALVEAATRAGLDEIGHARRCFRLATLYGGDPVGPGPLPLHGDLLGSLALDDLAAAAVVEGCVGETFSAAEARESLARVEVEDVRETLAVISEEEARHAELAWAFARWAVDSGGPRVRTAVRAAFERALVAELGEPPAVDPEEDALRAHGRLTARCRASVRARTAEEVIRPALAVLLQE